MNAAVSVVLFDQNLDQKIDLGWPGLAWVKPWAGPGQALGWAKVKPWAGPWENGPRYNPDGVVHTSGPKDKIDAAI